MIVENSYYLFEPVALELADFPSDGYILDIGGGGEGVIGQLKGRQVIAIDNRAEELEEAPEGPLKIVMDARDMHFLDHSFQTAAAFFSLMYLKTRQDQHRVLTEAYRVLKPGGTFHIWDIDLAERPDTEREVYIVRLRYRIGDKETGTGYGQRWPEEPRGLEDYHDLAEQVGFERVESWNDRHIFYLLLQKR